MMRSSSMLDSFRNLDDQVSFGRVLLNVCAHSLLTMTPVGYSVICLNAPALTFERRINQTWTQAHAHPPTTLGLAALWSAIVSSQSLGALCGCCLVVLAIRRYGTKFSLMVLANLVLVIGSAVLCFSGFRFWALFLGRFLVGIHSGLAPSILALYISQISPREISGSMGCFIHIGLLAGSLVGGVLSMENVLGSETRLRWLLSVPAFFALTQVFMTPLFPETPTDLMSNGDHHTARQSVLFYFGKSASAPNLMVKLEQERALAPSQLTVVQCIRDDDVRPYMFIGAVVAFVQIFTGGMAFYSYSTTIFRTVGFTDERIIDLVPTVSTIGSIVVSLAAVVLVERAGRRSTFLLSCLLCDIAVLLAVALGAVSLVWPAQAGWVSWTVAVVMAAFVAAYNLGVGPIAYFLAGELVPTRAKSAALSTALCVNWLSTLVSLFIYYPLEAVIGPFAMSIFFVATTVCLVWLYRRLPETKGRRQADSLVSIQRLLEPSTDLSEMDALSSTQILFDDYGTVPGGR